MKKYESLFRYKQWRDWFYNNDNVNKSNIDILTDFVKDNNITYTSHFTSSNEGSHTTVVLSYDERRISERGASVEAALLLGVLQYLKNEVVRKQVG